MIKETNSVPINHMQLIEEKPADAKVPPACYICLEDASTPYIIHLGTSQEVACQKCLQRMLETKDLNSGVCCPICRQDFTVQEIKLICGETTSLSVFDSVMRRQAINVLEKQDQLDENGSSRLGRLKYYSNYSFRSVVTDMMISAMCILAFIAAVNYIEAHQKEFKQPETQQYYPSVMAGAIPAVLIFLYHALKIISSLGEFDERMANFQTLGASNKEIFRLLFE